MHVGIIVRELLRPHIGDREPPAIGNFMLLTGAEREQAAQKKELEKQVRMQALARKSARDAKKEAAKQAKRKKR